MSKFQVVLNALEVINIVNGREELFLNSLTLDILDYIALSYCVSLSHIPRILNGAAHMAVKLEA